MVIVISPYHKIFFFPETEIVYEDDEFIVFNDYRPAAEFHILIIPKKHYGPLTTLNEEGGVIHNRL